MKGRKMLYAGLFVLGLILVLVYLSGYNRHRIVGKDAEGDNIYQYAWHVALPGWETLHHNEHTVDPETSAFAGSSPIIFERLHPATEGYSWTEIEGKRVRHKPYREERYFTCRKFYRVGPWHDGW
jgi:hypothetical protein